MALYTEGLLYQNNDFSGSQNCAVYAQHCASARFVGNHFSEADAALVTFEDCFDRLEWP